MIKKSIWTQLPLLEQLAHVGAEIHRAGQWEKKNDLESRNKSLERAIGLLDSILDGSDIRYRTKEITRLRETICGCYTGKDESDVSLSALDDYFLTLALYVKR